MSRETSPVLYAQFEAAYVYPIAKYLWKSKRGRACWLDLEGWQDSLAGPVYSVIETGNCAYVYMRNDNSLAGIDDPSKLHARLEYWHGKLVTGLDQFAPTSQDEEIDLASMRHFAAEMWTVAEAAIEIERARWESTGN